MNSIDEIVLTILQRRATVPETRCLLVGVSGIDGCGKGYVADLVFENDSYQSAARAFSSRSQRWLCCES